MDLLSKIQTEAFSNIDLDESTKRHINGWMTKSFIDNFKLAIKYLKKTDITIIEVGSWKGLSANLMAQYCRENLGDECKVICIDTWLGSPEHQDKIDRKNGYPNIYEEFLVNTKFLKNDHIIYPFPISSTQGAHYLKSHNVKADIIYIDAGHEYDSILLDAKLYWNLLNEGGVMIFDDYSWPDVARAVDDFFADKSALKIVNKEQAIVFM